MAGDWTESGLSRIGVYRPSDRRFYLDLDGSGSWNSANDLMTEPFAIAGNAATFVPVIGDWNGDGKDEIGIFGADTTGSMFFAMDQNSNKKWDGGTIDKLVYFGQGGDMPIAGKWNNSQRSYIGVYRPGNSTFYLDWDGDFQWNSANDKSFYFWKSPGPSANLQPLVGDWNETGKETVGLFDANAAIFYLDYNNDFAWDDPNDMSFNFGQKDDKPISGRWQKRENFWLANHSVRPNPGYMGSTATAFAESFLVYQKAHEAMPSEFFHNVVPVWSKIKEYLDTTNFKWKIDAWGLTTQPSEATFLCLALNTDCNLEGSLLAYKAADPQESSFIITPVPKQTAFVFKQEIAWDYEGGAVRYINTALNHDTSLLRTLPLSGVNQAQFVSQSVPSSMSAGNSYQVSVTMRNTGTTIWRKSDNYKLGSQNPRDSWTWGFSRVELGDSELIGPSQTKTFTFTVKAPATAGSYNFQWGMLEEFFEWFGDSSPNILISVSSSDTTPPTAPSGVIVR